ncbi:hypothetical protein NDU88_007640 [Pleurodeles waltl]|uniref:Uncharacterized protein n=1 Tax=Pleurodeles waltl TaxID=8319 RepID=A0AAV7VV07_PLEWA|nr:hypothetical protein NDU88_007640 [Pleurodeles waltl]
MEGFRMGTKRTTRRQKFCLSKLLVRISPRLYRNGMPLLTGASRGRPCMFMAATRPASLVKCMGLGGGHF